VSDGECEEIFFNHPHVMGRDEEHSQDEPRFFLLGVTNAGRRLFLSFTLREDLIRVISARDMNRKERRAYGHA
jgi:hypothetical protein